MTSRKINIFLHVALYFFLCLSFFASDYLNDNKYSDAINSNNTWRKSWTVMKLNDIPAELQKFAVTTLNAEKNTATDKTVLIPCQILFFGPDGAFTYYKMDIPKCLHAISGTWKVDNSMLILKLSNDCGKTPAGTEFRYYIEKLINNETGMKLSRTKYPDIKIIANSSDNPMQDMLQLLTSIDKQKTEEKTIKN